LNDLYQLEVTTHDTCQEYDPYYDRMIQLNVSFMPLSAIFNSLVLEELNIKPMGVVTYLINFQT